VHDKLLDQLRRYDVIPVGMICDSYHGRIVANHQSMSEPSDLPWAAAPGARLLVGTEPGRRICGAALG
jgi:hypothetical protein